MFLALAGDAGSATAAPAEWNPASKRLGFHAIRTDAGGKIVPWAFDDLGRSYDHVVRITFKFWDRMEADRNGLPYHMNHQVWRPDLDDHRGLGGDQIQMALSSWALLYQYIGNETHDPPTLFPARYGRIVENMRFMADWLLTHGMSGPKDKWPNIPYPYNTLIYSGVYDGDMILGKGFTQPDKAGSLGWELITLHQITNDARYLDAAIAIADTLAAKTKKGDNDSSPLPFKVNAVTGEVGRLISRKGDTLSSYTTNWSGTLRLFAALEKANKGNVKAYRKAAATIMDWMKQFPMKTNKWGPFFEDIEGWSDTQINAVTFAEYLMDNTELVEGWDKAVRGILDWVYKELSNHEWDKYGVLAINEQTAYRVPGNSHTARQASAELRYTELTGDSTRKEQSIRQLSWATYMVDVDGKNRYPRDDVWMTDGYGDYIRHYLRAMAAAPELAPTGQDHILRSTSSMQVVRYGKDEIKYRTSDFPATEILKLSRRPRTVVAGGEGDVTLNEVPDVEKREGWTWQAVGTKGAGVMRLRHDTKANVTIRF
jgi:hypothetical protein